VGCFSAKRSVVDWGTGERETWIAPGMGILAYVDGDYSPESGDGNTEYGTLVVPCSAGAKLAAPMKLADEPADFAPTRDSLRKAFQKKDAKAAIALTARAVQWALDLEHIDREFREELLDVWSSDGGFAFGILADVLSEPCKLVTERTEYIACPASFAEQNAAVARGAPPSGAKGARAIFERERARGGCRQLSSEAATTSIISVRALPGLQSR
jgi:hypothetical protein